MRCGFVGGIAGRQARGASYNVYSLARIGVTSAALLNDAITVNNKTDFVVSSLCDFTFGDIVDYYIDSHETFEQTANALTIDFAKNNPKEDEETNVVSAYSGIVISTEDTSKTIAITSLSARYFTDISAKDSYIMPGVFHDNYTSARVFQLVSIVNDVTDTNCKLSVSSDSLLVDLEDSTNVLSLDATFVKINNAYCVAAYKDDNISELAICTLDNNTYSGVNGMTDIKLVTPEVTQIIVTCSADVKQYVDQDVYSAAIANLTVQFDISLTDLGSVINKTYDSAFNKTPISALQIVLAPLIHAGGYCGEYVFSDMSEKSFLTMIDANTVDLYDFTNYSLNNVYSTMGVLHTDVLDDNDILDRQYSAYNTVSEFVADMTFDTMNKSNTDLLSAYAYTSANSLQKLKFNNIRRVQNIDEFRNSIFASLKSYSQFIRYVNYTPDAMPAVIVNEMHGADHTKSQTKEPNYGITWLDQLFSNSYSYAHTYNHLDNDGFEEAYINSIAEISAHTSKKSTEMNSDDKIDCWCDNTKIFGTYITLTDDEYQLNVLEQSYITKQQSRRNNFGIKEPQYLSCRIGMYDNTVSYETGLLAGYYDNIPISIAAAPAMTYADAEQQVVNKLNKIDNIHPDNVKPAYTYTYSSNSAAGLPVLSLTLGYTDNYVFTDELTAASLNKAYALTSDSYYAISADNDTYANLPVFMHNGEPLYKNSLVFGYIPGSANILSCLDQDVSRHLYCSGISANDIQYMLVVDTKKRPIFDVKLDVTAADNDGYVVDFEKIQTITRTETGDVSGLAINIVNG